MILFWMDKSAKDIFNISWAVVHMWNTDKTFKLMLTVDQ